MSIPAQQNWIFLGQTQPAFTAWVTLLVKKTFFRAFWYGTYMQKK